MHSFADQITAYAQTTNVIWPYFTMPLFEPAAENIRAQSRMEILAVAPLVRDVQQWILFANSTYKNWVEEGHMLSQGNLNRLNPTKYRGYLTQREDTRVVRDTSADRREINFPLWSFSPPPATYGILNWNFVSEEGYEKLVEATFRLGNETCVGSAFGDSSVVTQTLALTPQEHARMHNELRSSSKSFPHSFFVYPVRARIKDPAAPLVALAVGMASWDVALRNLLPVGVNGIFAVLRNSCGQEYTYEISGPDALFQGNGDLHEAAYDSMKVSVDLNPHQHPNFRETEGHCLYQMVSLLRGEVLD